MTREQQNAYIREWKRAKRADPEYRARESARDAVARQTRTGTSSASAARRVERASISAEREMLYSARKRAKAKGLPFSIEEIDIVIPSHCPVLGIPLVRHVGEGKGGKPDSPSLDRIVPERGYVRGNVRVISQRANTIKQDATLAEIEAVASYMRREQS